MILIDNGFALNVCPFKTTPTIGLDMETIIPCPLTVRAYDNPSRKVMGTFKAPYKIGPRNYCAISRHGHHPKLQPSLRKSLASPQWGNPLFTTPKDEDPMERRDCHSAWRWRNSSIGLWT